MLVTRKVLREGGSAWSGQRRVMSGERGALLETGDAHVSG